MTYPLEHHDVLTNGVRLHVVQCGPADGPLVVLLHGFPEYWFSWRAQLPALAAAGYRVWVPDQRGYNLSDKPVGVESYALPTLAADIIGLIDAAGQAQAAVVGHDWGGIVAWYLAAHHPGRVANTTIINVPHPAVVGPNIWQAPDQLLRSWYIAFFQLPGLPERLISRRNWQFGAAMLVRSSRPGTFGPAEVARYKAAWSRPGAITGMLNWYRALLRAPVSYWPRIGQPLQIIWGEHDAFLNKKFAQLSLAECAQGTLHYFPEATHWVQLEEAGKVNALLVKFLRQEAAAIS
ncbi:MAG TPA: alpha/beta hydrolase [Hymenobacter sp.]|uniref:alpha/beta fold hydrolase n=1 Tax=Hymenobacter sp. TaxID=1898978 RepID=UPI002D7FF32D|nr:alpha/beta hydrolase [Hymenobacter sp.]HET9505691.1 alpha/beta hydrolase [Hymenobacter sp.]